ncbi:e3 ubiquitin-protein [Cyclospora cayetanensis]|uniref:HECT-type E3 ubiquitin transferase n=1 Tax=Cyclospora cayetanensis TaxID=88456 RepID=A0A1D3D3C5_9EIME|nr:e3 ubiquitin-protein [Cyclospora cayetanensis]
MNLNTTINRSVLPSEEKEAFPVDLAAANKFYQGILKAVRTVGEREWDPIEIMLKAIENLCEHLLRNAAALREPQQLAFIPILLDALLRLSVRFCSSYCTHADCPFLEEDADVATVFKLCQVVAALPYESRCTIARWCASSNAAKTAASPNSASGSAAVDLHVPLPFDEAAIPYVDVPSFHMKQHLAAVQQLITGKASTGLSSSLRLLAAGPLEMWHYLEATAHPAEAALRSSLQLLHLLYVANVNRQQRRLQLQHWRQQRVPSGGEEDLSLVFSQVYRRGAPADATLEATISSHQPSQQEEAALEEVELGLFHSDAINSSIPLLQHEFALWLRLRRGVTTPRVSSVLLHRIPQQRELGVEIAGDTEEDAAEDPLHIGTPESLETQTFFLLAHPFVLDASSKADILRKQATIDQQHQARQAEIDSIVALCTGGAMYPTPFLYLRVRRSHLVQDTLQQIACNSSSGSHSTNTNFRKALKVKFVGEEGVDQGGVAKEFFQLLVDEVGITGRKEGDSLSPKRPSQRSKLFSPDYGMFSLDEESRMHWFCSFSLEGRYRFELIGIICGLAIHNSVLMPVSFPLVLFKKLLGWPANSLEDLYQLHPQIARHGCTLQVLVCRFAVLSAVSAGSGRSLRCVLEATEEVLEGMALTFSVSSDFLGEQREDALGSHDPSTRVTVANREEYVQLYINYILEVSVREQYSAFEEGFYRCVDKATISLFRPEELQLLLLGKEEELDVSLLQKVYSAADILHPRVLSPTAATYQDGYTEDSPAVSMFWSVCRGFSPEEKKKLLMFITGSDRIPLGGPQSLRLTIGRSGPDTDRLPTAHTCFNFLLLPDYSSKEKMARLLLIAIQNCHGFGLR